MYKQDLTNVITKPFSEESEDVIYLTKYNIEEFAAKTGIKVSYFPKPVQEDILMKIHNAVMYTDYLYMWENDFNYMYLLLAYMFSGIRCKMKQYHCGNYSTLQSASNVCFLLALNGLQLVSVGPIDQNDFDALCAVNMSGHLCYEDCVVLSKSIKRCGLKII